MRGVDVKFNEHAETETDDFVIGDLRDQMVVHDVIDRRFDEVYQLAADMYLLQNIDAHRRRDQAIAEGYDDAESS